MCTVRKVLEMSTWRTQVGLVVELVATIKPQSSSHQAVISLRRTLVGLVLEFVALEVRLFYPGLHLTLGLSKRLQLESSRQDSAKYRACFVAASGGGELRRCYGSAI